MTCPRSKTQKEKIISDIAFYITEVLEKPRDEYSGLPACPFVKKERVNDDLMIDVFDNNKENFLEKIEKFVNSKYTDAVFAQLIDETLTTKDSKTYQTFLNGLLKQHFKQLKVIVVNPNDNFSVLEFNPRSLSPYYLIVVTNRKKLSRAHKKMLKSKYFTNFDDDYLKYLHVKKEDIRLK